MRRVESAEPLAPVAYWPRGSRGAVAYLRKNIKEEAIEPGEGEGPGPHAVYSADEVRIETGLSEVEVEAAFDALWAAAERPHLTVADAAALAALGGASAA